MCILFISMDTTHSYYRWINNIGNSGRLPPQSATDYNGFVQAKKKRKKNSTVNFTNKNSKLTKIMSLVSLQDSSQIFPSSGSIPSATHYFFLNKSNR